MKAVALQSTSNSAPAKKKQQVVAPQLPVSPWFMQPISSTGSLVQRKATCACGGGCPSCEKESDAFKVQTKLAVSEPGDEFEQEADTVADQVMRMPDPMVQRQRKDCSHTSAPDQGNEERGQLDMGWLAPAGGAIQRRAHDAVPPSHGPAGAGALVSSGGEPLDPVTHQFMASRFGVDFSEVRVHHGALASGSAAELNAAAYTLGNNVVFGAGRYRPHASEGRWLIAHELTHVLQQSAAPVASRTAQRVPVNATPAYDVNDAIAQLRIALAAAAVTLKDPALPAPRRTRITAQQRKLQPLLNELIAKGDKATLSFNPDPRLNEIHPGDSAKTLAELYGGAAPPHANAPPLVSANESPGAETPAVLQAFALPGGLTITPMTFPVAQRFAFIAVGVIVLAGLLLSGCQSSTPPPAACVPPPIPPGGFPLTLKPIIAAGTLWDTDGTQRGYIAVRTAWATATWRRLAHVEITVEPVTVQPIATEVMQPTLSSIAGAHGGNRRTIIVIFLHKNCADRAVGSLCPAALTSRGSPPAIGMPVVQGDRTPVGQCETCLGHELGHVLLNRGEHADSGLMRGSGGPYPATLSADEICTAQHYF